MCDTAIPKISQARQSVASVSCHHYSRIATRGNSDYSRVSSLLLSSAFLWLPAKQSLRRRTTSTKDVLATLPLCFRTSPLLNAHSASESVLWDEILYPLSWKMLPELSGSGRCDAARPRLTGIDPCMKGRDCSQYINPHATPRERKERLCPNILQTPSCFHSDR